MENKHTFWKFSIVAFMFSLSACEKTNMEPSSIEKTSSEKSEVSSFSSKKDLPDNNKNIPYAPHQYENQDYNVQVSNINNKSVLTLVWPHMFTVLYPNTVPVASTVNIVIEGSYDDGKVKRYYFYNAPLAMINVSYNGGRANAVEFDLANCDAYFSGSIRNTSPPVPVSGQLIADDYYTITVTASNPNHSLVPNDRGIPEPYNTITARMYINDL